MHTCASIWCAVWDSQAIKGRCCCTAAGLPNDNDTIYCPGNETSCYFWFPQTLNNASASAKCEGIGGYLASWNTAAEQLLVEGYFRVGLLLWLTARTVAT
jgi:hypothetical protein